MVSAVNNRSLVMAVKEKRPYELRAPEYALIQDVRARFGVLVSSELECILAGSVRTFYNTPKSQEDTIRLLAKAREVKLP